MLRLSPADNLRFVQADNFEVIYGGGEANVAVSLANFGCEAYFVTKLPANTMGQAATACLRRFGVKTDYIKYGGNRLGIYFLEHGVSQRPSKVIYDRANSSIAETRPGDFDWSAILDGCKWLHVTGITPSLSDETALLTGEAMKAASANEGCTVSFDLNYRKNLWSKEKARKVVTDLMQYVDVCVGNEEDAESVFGIKADNSDIYAGELDQTSYKKVAKQVLETFNLSKVAFTMRESISASDNNWSAILYDAKDYHFSNKYNIHIVDRVGGGDSFAAGLIYGLLSGKSNQDALEFAVAASCLKHSIKGDFNLVSADEVENLARGDKSGRVDR